MRQEQAISLPTLPDGDEYEIVVGLWYDEGKQSLRDARQLLGNDVIRIATISALNGHYEILPYGSSATGGSR